MDRGVKCEDVASVCAAAACAIRRCDGVLVVGAAANRQTTAVVSARAFARGMAEAVGARAARNGA